MIAIGSDELTHDEWVVLQKYRKAKAMNSARVYINVEQGTITQLDVTEKETAKSLRQLNGRHKLMETK